MPAGPTHEGDRIVPYLLSRPPKNNATPWGLSFDVCARVLAFFVCFPSVSLPLSLALLEGRGFEKEVSFDFENRKLVSVLVMEFGKE